MAMALLRRLFLASLIGFIWTWSACAGDRVQLGEVVFNDVHLSRDGATSCRSCHDPAHAYADSRATSVGADGQIGTRNAPSLIGVTMDASFFWDGRRNRLEDVVLDPFTNPVELGLASVDELLARVRSRPYAVEFRSAFPDANAWPTREQIQNVLIAFIRTLTTGTSAFDRYLDRVEPLSPEAEQGRLLFGGVAGCSNCHTLTGKMPSLSDGVFHHSGIGQDRIASRLSKLTVAVVEQNRTVDELGPILLSDRDWSALGRFAVSHQPVDVSSFKTPTLRNVAITAPYMHDGSIPTLSEAVNHEIYYRGRTSGRSINLSASERRALVAFLEALTDKRYVVAANQTH